MAWSFIGSSSSGWGSSISVTLSRPGSSAADDLAVVVLYKETNPTWTTPSGWTQIGGNIPSFNSPTPNQMYIAVFYKRLTSSEPSDYTFSLPGPSFVGGALAVYRGAVLTGIPLDVSASLGTSTTTLTAASITTTANNTLMVVATANFNGEAVSAGSSGYTENEDFNGIALYSSEQATAGASGTKTFNSFSASGDWASLHMAFLPEVAVASTDLAATLVSGRTLQPVRRSAWFAPVPDEPSVVQHLASMLITRRRPLPDRRRRSRNRMPVVTAAPPVANPNLRFRTNYRRRLAQRLVRRLSIQIPPVPDSTIVVDDSPEPFLTTPPPKRIQRPSLFFAPVGDDAIVVEEALSPILTTTRQAPAQRRPTITLPVGDNEPAIPPLFTTPRPAVQQRRSTHAQPVSDNEPAVSLILTTTRQVLAQRRPTITLPVADPELAISPTLTTFRPALQKRLSLLFAPVALDDVPGGPSTARCLTIRPRVLSLCLSRRPLSLTARQRRHDLTLERHEPSCNH